MGMPDTRTVGRRLASTMPLRCFPDVRWQHQHPQPTLDPAVPISPPHGSETHAPPLKVGRYLVVFGLEKT
jgi:hypothetical protein